MNRQKEMFEKYKTSLKKNEFKKKLKLQRRKFHEEEIIRKKVQKKLEDRIYDISEEDFNDLVEDSINGDNIDLDEIELRDNFEKNDHTFDEGFLDNMSQMCFEIENNENIGNKINFENYQNKGKFKNRENFFQNDNKDPFSKNNNFLKKKNCGNNQMQEENSW